MVKMINFEFCVEILYILKYLASNATARMVKMTNLESCVGILYILNYLASSATPEW